MEAKLHPIAGRHAVQSAVFVINFASDLEAEKISAHCVDEMKRALDGDFSKVEPVQSFTFQLGAIPSGASSAPKVGGWQFSIPAEMTASSASPFRRVLSVQGPQFNLTEYDYERWAGFEELIYKTMKAARNVAFNGRAIREIALAYVDVFVWKGNPKEVSASTLFQKGAKYLPSHVFDVGSEYFHSSHGFMSQDVPVAGGKLIENVNIARTPGSDGVDSFVINTEHRIAFGEPLYDFDGLLAAVEASIGILHLRNKEKLKEVLVEEVQRMIKLEG